MGKKYFLYSRVSDDEYEKSIDNQKDVLLKVANDKKINVKDIIILEEHESGKKANKRPLFDEMMDKLLQDIENNKKKSEERVYGWILFFKIDRLARNDKDFERLLRLLDCWYQFISATETIENTPTGRLLFRLLAWFAVYESEKLSSRIVLSRIHSLIKKEFESLGGDIVIFGYEYDKDKKAIVLNNTEKDIIMKVYNQYLSGERKDYKDIFNKFDKEYNWYLTRYLTREVKTKDWKVKTSKTTPSNFIRNILVNKNAMRYNWFIEINLSVNDEWIMNYLETIKQNNIDNSVYTLEGDVKIGWDVTFVYFAPELIIVPDSFHNMVVAKLAKNKNLSIENNERWLFTDILYVEYNGRLTPFSWKIDKKKEKYINYRIKVWTKYFNISEKKIEEKILSKKEVRQISVLLNKNILEIKEELLLNQKDNDKFRLRKQKLISTINIYRGMKEYYQYLFDNANENIEANLKSFQKFQALEEEFIQKEKYLSEDLYSQIEQYLDIIKIKDIKNEVYVRRMLFYQIIFKEIIYRRTNEKDFKIILHPFTFLSKLLWLPKETVI